MYRILLYTIISFLSLGVLCAQNVNSDGIKDIDPAVYEYYKLCEKNKNLPQIIEMSDTLYQMAEAKGDKRTMCAALCYKPNYYLNSNVTDSAEKYVVFCKQMSRRLGQPKYYYFIWNRQVQTLLANHKNAAAIEEMKMMQEEAGRENSPEGTIECYRALSMLYKQQNFFELALDYNTKLIDFVESNGLEDFNHIGTYVRQIEILLNLKKTKEAQAYIDKAQGLVTRDVQKIALLCAEICFYSDTRQSSKAESKVKELLSLVSIEQANNNVTGALSHYYYQNQQYEKTVEVLDAFREKRGSLGPHKRLYLSAIMHIPGRMEEAIRINKEILDSYDSILAAEHTTSLAEISALMDNQHLQEENAKMSQDHNRMMTRFYLSIICFLVILGLVMLFFLIKLNISKRKLLKLSTSKEAMETEIETAGMIQAHMIPDVFPAFPEREEFNLFAMMRPAKMIGGDLYDYFMIGNKLYFIVGDVSGKGVPASLFMSLVCSSFRSFAQDETDIKKIVRTMNHAVRKSNKSNQFVTLMAGVFDTRSGVMTLCNAGHNMPILIHENQVTELKMDSGLPLGLFDHNDYPLLSFEMHLDDKLVVYTDGVSEAENNNDELFGTERLQETLIQNAFMDATGLTKVVLDRVESFANGAPQSDDITIFTLQYNYHYEMQR